MRFCVRKTIALEYVHRVFVVLDKCLNECADGFVHHSVQSNSADDSVDVVSCQYNRIHSSETLLLVKNLIDFQEASTMWQPAKY